MPRKSEYHGWLAALLLASSGSAQTLPAPPPLVPDARRAVSTVEPEYSPEAREARLQGSVILSLEIDRTGRVQKLLPLQSLGLGLDEKAVEAVSQWRFRPAQRSGTSVVSTARVEVHFHLM